ncbi:hypothetical protein [Nocardia camponoti]|uniref:Uncharacterized protein n=1 Tax=Nocardia camponoti TaxID=1616106 RepID=A0A917QQ99_9NOCA|nr:hypothetical protein [Nocardia camponoti]GGK62769.1 hypothetical protein GCM10011591_38750 [Nocardia camponoti]
MTKTRTRRHLRATALLGGLVLITAPLVGFASADQGGNDEHVTITCTAPPGTPLPEFEHSVPASLADGTELVPAPAGSAFDHTIEAPSPATPLDGTKFVPAPPGSGFDNTIEARPAPGAHFDGELTCGPKLPTPPR